MPIVDDLPPETPGACYCCGDQQPLRWCNPQRTVCCPCADLLDCAPGCQETDDGD